MRNDVHGRGYIREHERKHGRGHGRAKYEVKQGPPTGSRARGTPILLEHNISFPTHLLLLGGDPVTLCHNPGEFLFKYRIRIVPVLRETPFKVVEVLAWPDPPWVSRSPLEY